MLRRDARWRKALQIGFILGGAALTGLCELTLNTENLPDYVQGVAQTLWFVGLLLILLAGAVLVFIDQTAPEVLAEADQALQAARTIEESIRASSAAEMAHLRQLVDATLAQVGDAERTIAEMVDDLAEADRAGIRLGTLYSLTRSALLEGVEAVALGGALDDEKRRKLTNLILDSFGMFSHQLFGFIDEYWALTVFVPEIDGDGVQRLGCYSTLRSLRNDEGRPHRRWEKGEGCAGLAWDAAEERVIPDITTETSLRVRKENRNGDGIRHRSLAAVPVLVGSEVVAVLCASSSVADRFVRPISGAAESKGIDAVEPLRAIASHLAILFALTHLNDSNARQN